MEASSNSNTSPLKCRSCNGTGTKTQRSKLGKHFEVRCRSCGATGEYPKARVLKMVVTHIAELRAVSPELFATAISALEGCREQLSQP